MGRSRGLPVGWGEKDGEGGSCEKEIGVFIFDVKGMRTETISTRVSLV